MSSLYGLGDGVGPDQISRHLGLSIDVDAVAPGSKKARCYVCQRTDPPDVPAYK